MATSYKTTLQALLLLCFLCNLVSSDDRPSFSNQFQSQSFGCLHTTNASVSFQNNVNILFSEFTQQSCSLGYYNTSIGDTPDAVYGYFMCRGDVSHEICNNCIVNGTQLAVIADCEYVDGNFMSDQCLFRYSNHNMYGLYETNLTSTYGYRQLNVSNYQEYNRTLSSTLESVINEAAFRSNNSGSILGFATMEANVTRNETIYTLAQCTPDIVGVNCSRCLHAALSQVETYIPAASSMMAKCYLRYDNVSFYNLGLEEFDASIGERFRSPKSLALYTILFLFVYLNFLLHW